MRHMQARVCVQMHHGADQGGSLSDIIDFMERMGGDAQLSQASTDELAAALSTTDIATELQSAVLAKDTQQLGILLGTKPMYMLVAPPGPPGSPVQSPMQPAVPPPPPEEEENETPTASFGHPGATEGTAYRPEPPRL
jgi:hypothetical protein